MHRFLFLIISVVVIAAIIFIAKYSGNPINFNSSDFYLNLITEVIGITLAVIILEIFGAKILRYLENKKNKEFNKYLNKRLLSIINKLTTLFVLLNIRVDKKIFNITEFVTSIDTDYLNKEEKRSYFDGTNLVSKSFKRPVLFYNEFTLLLKEADVLSKQLPQGLPNEIYDGLLMIISHDELTWKIFAVPPKTYNSGWLGGFKELIFDKYIGAKKLMQGQQKLAKIIK
ncbi:MAG: hypothetical protein ACOCWG_02710 [bacterium]